MSTVVLVLLLPSRTARIRSCILFERLVGFSCLWLTGCPLSLTGKKHLDPARPASVEQVAARVEALGMGDVKMLAMIGAFLGWRALPFVIFASALLGSVIGIGAMIKQKKGGKTVIPYGPFLAVASYLYLFSSNEIWRLADRYYFP